MDLSFRCARWRPACIRQRHRAGRHAARGLSRHQSGAGGPRRATGEVRGASVDLARELAKRSGSARLQAAANPPAVIEAVSSGAADIGFVAYEPSRVGTVEFSQTYMLVQQSFLVLDGSPIQAVADIDRAGQDRRRSNDSITLCLKRILKQATLVELENNPAGTSASAGKDIDAFGASRQRLTTLMGATPGTRLLPDNLFGVPQTIIVPKGRAGARRRQRFIDDVRASGFLKTAIENSGVIGLQAAPGGSWQPSVPD